LAVSDRWRDGLADIADGIGEAAAHVGARVVGGNTAAAGELSITTTVLGSAYTVLRRDALLPGDYVYVTGRLGGSGAAVAAWRGGRTPDPRHRARFAHPEARLREARWLAERGATCAIDISDGMAADIQHIAAASGVGVDVDLRLVPCVDGVEDIDAAASGEEYELVVGGPAVLHTEEFATTFGVPLTRIGRATDTHEGLELRRGGERVANPTGYDHLSR
jgi:thiamine-monophosphate kinase